MDKMDRLEDTNKENFPTGDTSGISEGFFPVSAEYISLKENKKEKKASLLNFNGPVFEMVISVKGGVDIHLKQKKETRRLNVSAGMFFLCLNHSHSSCSITTKDREAKILHLFYSCDALYSFIGVKDLPPVNSKISTKTMELGIVQQPSPPMSTIVADLYFLIENKTDDKMYLTLKALELLWLFFSSDFSKTEKNINSNDLIAIRKSVVILKDNMESPPCLNELAKEVGMSASKFKV
ncbi:MAG: hypothetical protein CSA25_02295, partial [Desulfobacter postgatei]